jgi:oligopeptide/dipeptide ABC transporter ATP-binding protein
LLPRVNALRPAAGGIGNTESCTALPRHHYTLGLLRSEPRLDQLRGSRLVPIDGQPPDLTRLDGGCAFRPRCVFAVDKCAESIPPVEDVDGGHLAACWEHQAVHQAMRKAS